MVSVNSSKINIINKKIKVYQLCENRHAFGPLIFLVVITRLEIVKYFLFCKSIKTKL